jgi:hypothetical protein
MPQAFLHLGSLHPRHHSTAPTPAAKSIRRTKVLQHADFSADFSADFPTASADGDTERSKDAGSEGGRDT